MIAIFLPHRSFPRSVSSCEPGRKLGGLLTVRASALYHAVRGSALYHALWGSALYRMVQGSTCAFEQWMARDPDWTRNDWSWQLPRAGAGCGMLCIETLNILHLKMS
jgi:hypothetical protein